MTIRSRPSCPPRRGPRTVGVVLGHDEAGESPVLRVHGVRMPDQQKSRPLAEEPRHEVSALGPPSPQPPFEAEIRGKRLQGVHHRVHALFVAGGRRISTNVRRRERSSSGSETWERIARSTSVSDMETPGCAEGRP
jgi:hypothetical protein